MRSVEFEASSEFMGDGPKGGSESNGRSTSTGPARSKSGSEDLQLYSAGYKEGQSS